MAFRCPTCPQAGWQGGPVPWRLGGVRFLAGPPPLTLFPYRPVLPRHKLQRLKLRGKKTNSGRGSLLPGGEPGIRGRWEELREYTCVIKGACVCRRGSGAGSHPCTRGSWGPQGAGSTYPTAPVTSGSSDLLPPGLAAFSSPHIRTASRAFPSSQTPSLLLCCPLHHPAPSQPFSGAGGPAGGMVWMTPLGRPPWQDSAPGLGPLGLGEEPPTPTGPVLP